MGDGTLRVSDDPPEAATDEEEATGIKENVIFRMHTGEGRTKFLVQKEKRKTQE